LKQLLKSKNNYIILIPLVKDYHIDMCNIFEETEKARSKACLKSLL